LAWRHVRIILAAVSLGGMGAPLEVHADTYVAPDPWQARAESSFRFSDDRRLNLSEYWYPLGTDPGRVTYVSVRTMADNLENIEGNLGLGRRQLYGDHVWGGYGYIDRRQSSLGSEFWQVTGGVEYYRATHDIRANVYVPFNPTRTYTTAPGTTPIIAGSGVYFKGPGTVIEEAQPGIDIEAGFYLPDLRDIATQNRIFGAVYHFEGDQTRDVTGARVRVQTDLASWLQLGARAQYDEARGGQVFAELTLRWPGRPKVVAHDQGAARLLARMSDTPERDIDIVTGGAATPGPDLPLIDAQTGAPARFIYVDPNASTSGDGSSERPYTSLAAALAAAQSHDTIYVQGSSTGPAIDGGHTIGTNHVTVHGSGSPLFLSGARYHAGTTTWSGDLLLRAASVAPMLTNSAGDIFTLTGDSITLRGLHLDGASGSGVVMTGGAQNITLEDMLITGNAAHGVALSHTQGHTMSLRVRGSTITGNALNAVLVDDMGLGSVAVDLGRSDDYGFNNLFDNLAGEIYARAPGGIILARGNYWGTGAPVLAGPNAGAVDTAVALTTPLCTQCLGTGDPFASGMGTSSGGSVHQTNTVTWSGFRGSRYIQATAIDGGAVPEWIVNGTATGGSVVRIRSGDTLALNITPALYSGSARYIQVTGAGLGHLVTITTP
jgi:hypothetical protein